MPVDTPAYVQKPSFVTNGVKVQAGTNWDVSRTAVATPIVPLADPEPVRPAPAAAPARDATTRYLASDGIPAHEPVVLGFASSAVALSSESRATLRGLSKGEAYVIVGHADHDERNGELVSRQRANAVAAQLKRQGFKVVSVKSFGNRRSLTNSPSAINSRVDVVIR